MPSNASHTHIQRAWIDFTNGAKLIFELQADDRFLDQYLIYGKNVFDLVQSEQFLKELNDAWAPFTDGPMDKIGVVLLMELEGYPRAVRVATNVQGDNESRNWKSKLFGHASIVAGSVKDILNLLPPYAKSAITLFQELMDLFKGKE